MNGFVNVAPATVSDINGENPITRTFEAEQANQAEAGIKTALFDGKLTSTLSFYDIKVSNKVMPDPENQNNSIQGGEVESKGIDVALTMRPVDGLQLLAGYSSNDSKLLKGPKERSFLDEVKRTGDAGQVNLLTAWE